VLHSFYIPFEVGLGVYLHVNLTWNFNFWGKNMTVSPVSSAQLKQEGNELLKSNNLAAAIDKYTIAIHVDPENPILFSNRSAARLLSKDYLGALSDADRCLELAPEWPKSYARKVNALRASGDLLGARNVCDHALEVLPDTEGESLKVVLGEVDLELFKRKLGGTWRGKVSSDLGGYSQSMTFDHDNSMKVEVFGRTQTCTYSLDLSWHPHRITVCFGEDGTSATVPYIIEFRDEDQTLAMCCPYLVPEVPSQFEGPGLVLMRNGEYVDEEDRALEENIRRVKEISDPSEKLLLYLEDFAAIIAKIPSHDAMNLRIPEEDQEVEANKKVIEVMATHVKVSQLERIYGTDIAKESFGVISGGDAFSAAPEKVQVAAIRLKDLLLSTGFITPEGLEQAKQQYTDLQALESPESKSKDRLQRKLLARRSGVVDAPVTPSRNDSNQGSDLTTSSTEFEICPPRQESQRWSSQERNACGVSKAYICAAAVAAVLLAVWTARRLILK
jgi:hypothetical protein